MGLSDIQAGNAIETKTVGEVSANSGGDESSSGQEELPHKEASDDHEIHMWPQYAVTDLESSH